MHKHRQRMTTMPTVGVTHKKEQHAGFTDALSVCQLAADSHSTTHSPKTYLHVGPKMTRVATNI